MPISSSGHLVLFQNLLGLTEGNESFLAFDILLHIGTLISVLFIFWKDICGMVVAFFKMLWDLITRGRLNIQKSEYRKLVIMLIIASIPLVIGAILENYIEGIFSSVLFVGCALILTGVILIWTDKFKNTTKTLQTATFKDALIVGVAQLIAIVPGLSRSGSTIFGGVIAGLSREFAVKFSFLLSMVAILGAAAISIKDFSGGVIAASLAPAIAGTIVAAIVGIIAIKWLVSLISKGRYYLLAYYCFAVGIVSIICAL
ncbi:undecaprenyl-diphosphatase [Clostridia bacterium]|nr:undecaprenyl-diphosphatase [Clostridia bacterium]